MRTWGSLAEEAKSLLEKPHHWPAEISPRTQAMLTSFDRLCITRLQKILLDDLSDHERRLQIRLFFAMRWTVVAQSSLDYTRNPTLPSNAWYAQVAARIATEHCNTIRILMPTIKNVIGGDADLLSETIDAFQFTHFLVNANKDALIAIDDVYYYAKQDTNFLFPVIVSDAEQSAEENKRLFALTAEDREWLRNLTPQTQQFFDLLKNMHRIRHQQKPSVGVALRELSYALLKSSKIATGADRIANLSECCQPIIDFYHLWAALPAAIKDRIGRYHAASANKTLRAFLFVLFAHTPGIALTDAEMQIVDPQIIACTHMIGEQLNSILHYHPDLYNLPLPGCEQNFEHEEFPSPAVLDTLKEQCELSLANRAVMPGPSDAYVGSYLLFFTAFTENLGDFSLLPEKILAVQFRIRSLMDLKYALFLLPRAYWDYLFLLSRNTMRQYFHDQVEDAALDAGVDFVFDVLKIISEESRAVFFDVLLSQKYFFALPASAFSTLLDKFNESQWESLVTVMEQYTQAVLKTPLHVASLFNGTQIDSIEKIYQLFQAKINAIFNSPAAYAELFANTSRILWSTLFQLFSRQIISYIQNKAFLDEVLGQLDQERQLNLLELLVRCGVSREAILDNLPIILSRIAPVEWMMAFRILGIAPLTFPMDRDQFLAALNRIQPEHWGQLNRLFSLQIWSSIKEPENLAYVLNALSQDQWDRFLVVFFSREIRFPARGYTDCLSYLHDNQRSHFIEKTLGFLERDSIYMDFFADVLNLLKVEEWEHFAKSLFKYQDHAVIAKTTVIQSFLKKIPIAHWPQLKTVFSDAFDRAHFDETTLITTARDLSSEKIAPFFDLVSSRVKKIMTSIGYLKTIFYHVNDDATARDIAFSIAKHVSRFPMDMKEIKEVVSRAELLAPHNTFIIFEILEKEKIIQYFNARFPFLPNPNSSQLIAWQALLSASPDILRTFLNSPLSAALLFYVVPVHEWNGLATLFSEFLSEKLRDALFFQSILLLLPHENRYAFCAAVMPQVNPNDISLGLFSCIFSALPDENWRSFYDLLKSKKPLLRLTGVDELIMMLNRKEPAFFQSCYALLHSQIDCFLAKPVNLVKLLSAFAEEYWPHVVQISQLNIIEQCEKIDFLKNTLMALKKEKRFFLLQALESHFNKITVNCGMLIDVFLMLDARQWLPCLKLFGKENIARAIHNETDLALFLHGVAASPLELLQTLENYLTDIRCEHPKHLMRLLISFENCQRPLLHLFKKHLVEIMVRYISFFIVMEGSAAENHQLVFDFFVTKSLPIVLSHAYLIEMLNIRDENELLILNELSTELESAEENFGLLHLQYVDVPRCPLKIIQDFIVQVKKEVNEEKSDAESVRLTARQQVCEKLLAHFGPHFFEKITQYASCFHSPPAALASAIPPGVRPAVSVLRFPQRPTHTPRPPGLFAPQRHTPNTGTSAAGGWLENLFSRPQG